jgi:hypothetical protein
MAAALSIGCVLAANDVAHADDVKNACSDAYEATQTTRAAGKLRAARGHALACARVECPDVLVGECARWLGEIDASLPTFVIDAKTRAGADLTSVVVTVDGELVARSASGEAIAIDPGNHVIRVETSDRETSEQQVVMREGEKNRRVAFVFAGRRAPAPLAPLAPSAAGGGPPVATYVLGGVGLIGIGTFATLGLLGRSEQSDLEDTCMPDCSDDQVESVETKFAVADVALGVGLVALGVAAVLWITDEPDAPPTSRTVSRAPLAVRF